jgi:hypothetical protein
MLFYKTQAILVYFHTTSKFFKGNILSTQRCIGKIRYAVPIITPMLENRSNLESKNYVTATFPKGCNNTINYKRSIIYNDNSYEMLSLTVLLLKRLYLSTK